MKKSASQKSKSPSQLIDARIKELGGWRGKMLSRLRTLVKEADPEIVEEWQLTRGSVCCCLTRGCTGLAKAGFARLREQVNSNVSPLIESNSVRSWNPDYSSRKPLSTRLLVTSRSSF